MKQVEAKRYRILGVLGQGGFGKVYRARLEGPEGFTKDVAIKLMNDELADDETLMRFRDEARILGLVRDRAIVTVDPPMRLKGKWAVVMEYVDGTSAAKLLDDGPIPATVSLEIVQEVARALDKVYRFPGPQAAPLHLLHRDLKPANLQITSFGEVKILDFGTAKATFRGREANTTVKIVGTPGWIAPERMLGMDGPEGDIYSLGVVLQTLLSGRLPSQPTVLGHIGDDGRRAMEISRDMQRQRPPDRPTARQVEDRCQQLRRELSGPTLREWADSTVPKTQIMQGDALTGHILTQSDPDSPTVQVVPDAKTVDLGRSPNAPGNESAIPTVAWAVIGTAAVLLLVGVFGIGFGGMGLGIALQTVLTAPPPPLPPPDVALAEGTPPEPTEATPPKTTPAPRPRTPPPPSPSSKPKAEPQAEPLPMPGVIVEERGRVEVSGEVPAELRLGGQAFPIGPVDDGTYELWADFGDGMQFQLKFDVEMGRTIAVKCSKLKLICQVR